MIYYVIPRELADKYYEEFKKRFEGVEGVEVIIDRRENERRRSNAGARARTPRSSSPAAGRDPRNLSACPRSYGRD